MKHSGLTNPIDREKYENNISSLSNSLLLEFYLKMIIPIALIQVLYNS